MAENNPNIVLDTVIDAPKKVGDIEIGDITILKYSYLEKLNSPFISSSEEFTVTNIIPTVFVLSKDKKELRKYGNDIESLKLDALDWADECLKVEDVPALISIIVDKFTQMNKAAPSGESADVGDKKK